MPKLVTFNAQSSVQGGVPTRRATVKDIGFGDVGTGGAKVAEALMQVGVDHQKREEQAEVTRARQQMVEGGFEWDTTLVTRSKEAVGEAAGFSDTMSQDLTKWIEAGRENFTTEKGREVWDLKAAQLRGSIMSRSVAFQSAKRSTFVIEGVSKTVDIINNRTSNDPTYYKTGEAQSDLNDQVLELLERGVPAGVAEKQKRVWQTNLNATAGFSSLAAADTPQEAKAFLNEVENTDTWKNKVDAENFAILVKSARKNVVNTIRNQRAEDNRLKSERVDANTAEMLPVLIAVTGPNPPPDMLAKAEVLRNKAMANPEAFNPSIALRLDGALDRRETQLKNSLTAETREAAERFDFSGDNTVDSVNRIVNETNTPEGVIGLSVAIQALRERNNNGGGGGLTSDEWNAAHIKALRKLHTLDTGGTLTDDQANTKEATFQAAVTKLQSEDYVDLSQRANSVKTLEDVAVIEAALKNNKNLREIDRSSIRNRLKKPTARILKATIQRQDKVNERGENITVANLDRLSRRPDLTAKDITRLQAGADDLLRKGKINPDKWTTISARLDKEVIESAKEARQSERVHAILQGKPSDLNPGEREDRDAVDVAYKRLEASFAEMSAPDKADAQLFFVKRTRVVPTAMQNEIIGALNSEEPTVVVDAAARLEKITNISPQLSAQFGSGEAVSFGRQVIQYNQWGLEPEKAFERTKELRNVKEAVAKSRKNAFGSPSSGIRKSEQLDKFLENAVDEDNIPPVLTSEFMSMVEAEYIRSGDIDVAKNNALASFRTLWGAHHQGGNAILMKRPPQLFYGVPFLSPEENSEWIMEQLITNINARGMTAEKITPERILITQHMTKSNGQLPAYQITLRTPTAVEGVVDSTPITDAEGQPLAWWPDYKSSPAGIRKAKEDRERLVQAQIRHDRRKQGLIPQDDPNLVDD